jgi:hypothetical protein
LSSTFNQVGAFTLPASSKDAAILLTLTPGAYTAVVSGINGSTGVALVEVYATPSSDGLPGGAPLAAPLTWITTAPLVYPKADASRPIVAVKDPSVVFHDGLWHIVATIASTNGWRMGYLNFTSWDQAADAKLVHLEDNPHFTGHYNCAPQVFYFRPHKKWYLIFQSQQPRFSTTDNITDVMSWSKPQDFFVGTPKSVVEGWIDYWIICDDTHAYLFFSDDHGRYYRSRTRIEDFPRGFDEPVIVMQEANAADLFEGSCVYRIKGTNQFLCLIECADKNWTRYYRAFTADRLDGEWKPLPGADSAASPFAGNLNVSAEPGATPWANGISHGELLREGSDETMTVDPKNLQLLYQGLPYGATAPEYLLLPYRLALLRAASAAR